MVEADIEAYWAKAERTGRRTGHVVCICPRCHQRCMVSIINESGTGRATKSGGGWPWCKVCHDPEVRISKRTRSPFRYGPRVEPLGDVSLVRRIKPGGRSEPPSGRQMIQDGLVIVQAPPGP